MCLFYSKNGSQAYKNFTGKVISVFDNATNEYTLKDGFLHSFDDLPSMTTFNGDMATSYRTWHTDGIRNRLTGPAVCVIVNDGVISFSKYYINGVRLSFGEFIVTAKISDEQKIELVLNYG